MDTFRADVKKLLGGTGSGEIDRPANKPEVEQKPVKPQPAPAKVAAKVDVTYRVRGQKGVWYPAVKNLEDYAGVVGDAITDVAIKVSQGSVKYRVHVKGGEWLPYVTGYNINDAKNGYAGSFGQQLDRFQIIIE